MYLIPRFIFDKNVKGILFFQKGEKIYKRHCFVKKKYTCNTNTYRWYGMIVNAKEVAKRLKEKEGYVKDFYDWYNYFSNPNIPMKEQVGYDEEKDCVVKKPTIVIRTKSGDTLYAVFETDFEAEIVINSFYKEQFYQLN